MPTINELVRQCESEVESADERESQARRELGSILSAAESENRAMLRSDEATRTESLFKDIELARASGKRARARLERAREVAVDEERIQRQQADVRDTGARPASRTATFSVTRNERTYNQDRDDEAGGKPGSAFLRTLDAPIWVILWLRSVCSITSMRS
jgi:hypothetical protein